LEEEDEWAAIYKYNRYININIKLDICSKRKPNYSRKKPDSKRLKINLI